MPVTKQCVVCGAAFQQPPSRAQRVTMCSRACMGLAARKGIAERFWTKVDKEGPVLRPELGPCWLWTGDQHNAGYGRLTNWVDGRRAKPLYAHRVSWELAHGERPAGFDVLHRCDNPPCVNPDHLFLGTQLDNMRDRDAKGRVRHGDQHVAARLTAEKVRRIRALYATGAVSHRQLGKLFDVSHVTIGDVLEGKTWRRA